MYGEQEKTTMVFDIEKLSNAEFRDFDANGDLIYDITFKRVYFEENKSFIYFKIRAIKTLVFENFKIKCALRGENLKNKIDNFPPTKFNVFEAEIILSDKEKLTIKSQYARMSNGKKIYFPRGAKLTISPTCEEEISSIQLEENDKITYTTRAGKKSEIKSPTKSDLTK